MTGKELWEEYQHYTRDITDHGRKLGLAGVAVCWIFRRVDFTFPIPIYAALLFFVSYFIADIFQSFIGALTVKFFTEHYEGKLWREKRSIEGEIPKPRWVDGPAFCL